MLFMHLIGLVDIFVLSRISDDASAAVGAVNTVMTFVIMMFSFMGQGGSLVYAQCLGAGRPDDARRYYSASLVLHLAAGVTVSLLLFVFAPDIARLLGLGGVHFEYGATYLRVVGGGIVFYAVVSMFAGIMSANGHTRQMMTASVLTNVLNTGLLYVLVLSPAGPQWGVAGAAWSTVTASFVGLAYNVWLVAFRLRIRFAVALSLRDLVRDGRILLRYTVPTTLEPMLWQAAQIVATAIITALGPVALAARIYTLTITNLIGMFSSALSQGLQITVGHLAGAGDAAAVRRTYRWVVWIGLAVAVLLAAMAGLLSGPIMRIFTDDPDVVRVGQLLLAMGLVYLPSSAVIMNTAGALRGVGQVRYPALVGIVVLWTVFLPLAYTLSLPLGLGVLGVMIAMGVDENLRAVLLVLRWRRLIASPDGTALLARTLISPSNRRSTVPSEVASQ
ncbi:putative efflux protein, MATE family [Micromonospora phaseoli]|uniref:Putative efflux protein, MATE family n=2 Tax=Micromonospora phaseoli TaxID=1144548 RepID=A0A1H7DTU4_9ACTN|nr:putative MATE family efflux protein [Micromonospora phaseoli]GIJ78823.1 MATE family efflux transporter [Micromonospora phaseoli]SEK04277.1 putative efflux protein, MATE family [Micromonospora phaseoli]